MKNLRTLLAKSILAITMLFGAISCEDAEDGIQGPKGDQGSMGSNASGDIDLSKPLEASVTPNFLKLTSDFSSTVITPILSSEDVIPGSPEFVWLYG